MTRKRARLALLLALYLCVFCAQACEAASDKPELLYFYVNYCDACDVTANFEADFYALTGLRAQDYECRYYNTAGSAGMAAYREAFETYALSEERARLPLLIADGRAYAGTEEIQTQLPEYAISRAGGTDSVLYYLYVTPCESCAQASEFISAIPQSARAKRGEYAFQTDIRVIPVDIGTQTQWAYALFDAYQVPEEERTAPMALAGDAFYAGVNRVRYLAEYGIYEGAALGTRLVEGEKPLPYLRLGATALAGLVGGLNPCALSMLLLFLSMLMQGGKAPARGAIAFLVSKFIVYFAIGTVFLALFRAWNPVWLPFVTKLVLTAACAVLIAMNLSDARRLAKGEYGQVANQLPRGLRRRLNAFIERAMKASGRRMALVCALVGAFVAAGEFLCAGQVYLATLLSALNTGDLGAYGYALLAAYCAAFLAPACALSALCIRGHSALSLSQRCLQNMPLVKLITSAVLAAAVALAWLL